MAKSKNKYRRPTKKRRRKCGRPARDPVPRASRSRSKVLEPYWRGPLNRFREEMDREGPSLSVPEEQTLFVLCGALPDEAPPWQTASWASFLSTEFYLHVDDPLDTADALDLVDDFFAWCAGHELFPNSALADLLDAVDEHRLASTDVRRRAPKGTFMERRELTFLAQRFLAEAHLGSFLMAHPALVKSALSIAWDHLGRYGRPGRWDGMMTKRFLDEVLDEAPAHNGKLDESSVDLVRIVAAFIEWLPSPYLDPREKPRLVAPLNAFLLSNPCAA